jgi:hypothetical protein
MRAFSDNSVFLLLTLLRQAERSVNTWRLHAGNPSASQFVSTRRSSRLAHAPAQLSILVVLLSCDVYPQVDRASMCCGRVVRRNHAEPCLRAVVRGHRHALLPLRNCRHFVDSRWNRALPTSFVAILPSSLSSRSARSIGPQRQGSVGRRLPLMSFCSSRLRKKAFCPPETGSFTSGLHLESITCGGY